jgi:hypothetical protein
MPSVTILAGHPFFKFAQPAVWQMADGRWTVRWRDFYTMKQDRDFATEPEARAFASTVNQPPITVGEDEFDDLDFVDCDKFWRDLK